MPRTELSCIAQAVAALVLGVAATTPVRGQPTLPSPPSPLSLQSCTPIQAEGSRLRGAPAGAGVVRARRDPTAPIAIDADRISGRADNQAVAEGAVLLRQGPVSLRADYLSYDKTADEVQAKGRVRAERSGDVFAGSELQLNLTNFKGHLIDPEYFFARTNAGGRAQRIDFADEQRSTLTQADYTSCPRDEARGQTPAWLLKSSRVSLDFAANEGVAEGAVLTFLGVPILAAPVLRFPITDERKSGWLPMGVDLDNKKGIQLGVPYYWNIAPNYDATLTPTVYTRRGFAMGSEFRYLRPGYGGVVELDLLPNDRITGQSRHALEWRHRDQGTRSLRMDTLYERVSDDDYWKDFPRHMSTLTPRLLTQDLRVEHPVTLGPLEGLSYARVQRWQVLQDSDPLAQIVAPYQRAPQLGWRVIRPWRAVGANVALETELNRFSRPSTDAVAGSTRPEGWRAHMVGSVSRRWGTPGWSLEPGLKLNAASYRTDDPMADGRTAASRFIATASLDAGLVFERDSQWFGRAYRQTLEPRLRYLNTPFRDQNNLPNFDAAGTDFNVVSIFGDSAFQGVDRVSDAHQVTVGATSRWLDPQSGAERLRLGAVQRYLLRDQRITPDGVPITNRLSDVLLFGQSGEGERWNLGGAVQYSPEISRFTRSVLSARYTAGPFRTLGVGYRFVRNASEQVDIGWQWPIHGAAVQASAVTPREAAWARSRDCQGTLYSVGRVNYSARDRRITDSVLGFEYDAGCWIGRIVLERLSTGRSEATQRLAIQLELVGLSRLGSNPLRVLKDNIPGYRLLRDDEAPIGPPPIYD